MAEKDFKKDRDEKAKVVDLLNNIVDLDRILNEPELPGAPGIIEISHRFGYPIGISDGLPFTREDPRIIAINAKIYNLVRIEYAALLAELKLEYDALTTKNK